MGIRGMIACGSLVTLLGCAPAVAADTAEENVTGASTQVAEGLAGFKCGDGGRVTPHHLCPPEVPPALTPPADATLASGFSGRGVQIYVCTASADGSAPAWALKAPHAVLFRGHETQGTHFAGPSWQALDGSSVTGARLASAPAPDGQSIPWLLLKASAHSGAGIFATVTYIQRVDTEGGAAPATGCDAEHVQAEVLVPYRADYFFYRSGAATP